MTPNRAGQVLRLVRVLMLRDAGVVLVDVVQPVGRLLGAHHPEGGSSE
jgi:hypothetical protein